MARIFITGGTGCIGATTVHQLLGQYDDRIEKIMIASRSSHVEHLDIWFGDALPNLTRGGRLGFAQVDLSDQARMHQALHQFQPSHVIHLGALQSPDCEADPEKGVAINVTGTMNLLRLVAALETPLERFVFASSGAVYGNRAMYPGATVPENSPLAPPNLYGVWKVAGEYLAALLHQQTGTPTVSLRLNTTYGPGRDLGTTSAPTKVMKSLIIGAQQGKTVPFFMPYSGRENYHYVEDVGAHFAGVCMLPFAGCQSFNIKGRTVKVTDFLETVRQVAAEMGIAEFLETGIATAANPNLFICDLDDSSVEAHFPGLPRTDLAAGVRNTLAQFQKMAAAGKVKL